MKPERSLLVFDTEASAEAFCVAVDGHFSTGECPISPKGAYVFIGEHDEKTVEAGVLAGGSPKLYSELGAVMMWDVIKAEAQAQMQLGKTIEEAVEAGYQKAKNEKE